MLLILNFRCTCCIMPKFVTSLHCPCRWYCVMAPAAGITAPFPKKISQWWQAVGNTVSKLTARDLNLRPSAPEEI